MFLSYSPWLGVRLGPEGHFGDFVEGLGPSQLVGRQVLGSPCLGEIQLGIADRKGHLEVEVIRARGLMAKPGAKILPGESFLAGSQAEKTVQLFLLIYWSMYATCFYLLSALAVAVAVFFNSE